MSTPMIRFAAAALLFALLPAPSLLAQGIPGVGARPAVREPQSGEDAVKVSFAVVGDAKPGATVRVAATFEIIPDWHIYWENPGESGSPTQIELDLPAGCSMPTMPSGRPRLDYPVPSVFTHGETVFGYEKSVTLSVEVKLPNPLPAGGLPVTARASWLVCKERCLMGRGEGRVDLAKPAAADSKAAKAVAESISRLPKPLPADWKVSLADVVADSAVLVLEGPGSLGADADWQFIPSDTPGVLLASGYRAEAKGRSLRVPLTLSRESAGERALEAAGLIVLGKNEPAYSFKIPVPGK